MGTQVVVVTVSLVEKLWTEFIGAAIEIVLKGRRKCKYRGCSTILTSYNRGEYCFACSAYNFIVKSLAEYKKAMALKKRRRKR
jgi:hypothetical protein